MILNDESTPQVQIASIITGSGGGDGTFETVTIGDTVVMIRVYWMLIILLHIQ